MCHCIKQTPESLELEICDCSPHDRESFDALCMCVFWGLVTHLYEREQEAHSEVGQPVDSPGDHEGSRPVGLFKQLPGQDEGDTP